MHVSIQMFPQVENEQVDALTRARHKRIVSAGVAHSSEPEIIQFSITGILVQSVLRLWKKTNILLLFSSDTRGKPMHPIGYSTTK